MSKRKKLKKLLKVVNNSELRNFIYYELDSLEYAKRQKKQEKNRITRMKNNIRNVLDHFAFYQKKAELMEIIQVYVKFYFNEPDVYEVKRAISQMPEVVQTVENGTVLYSLNEKYNLKD